LKVESLIKKSLDPPFGLDIPGYGPVILGHLVSDFTGTLSVDGKLLPGIREMLNRISEFLKVHILTADTFGMAKAELQGIPCQIHILRGERHDVQKDEYVKQLGAEYVIAFGNGNNDRLMLKTAKIGVAVCLNEGCAADVLKASDILVTSITDGLDLLLEPKRMKATLRF
jgi:soluble P-type ATPase